MTIIIEKFQQKDLPFMVAIWNDVVNEGLAFPQEEPESIASAQQFFATQTYCGVARVENTGEVAGLYILHPNNIGRCGHICNASYAVKNSLRGRHIGEKLVLDSINQARLAGFGILQFNAVVCDNGSANHLYQRLGFQPLGTVPGGFRRPDGSKVDINLYYLEL